MRLKQLGTAVPLFLLICSSPLWGERVQVPDGTPVPVRLKAELKSSRVEPGDRVDFEVAHPVIVRGLLAIPEGSVAWGAVQSVKKEKEIKFDVQGLRLPNLKELKLRSVRQKTKNPGKDQIKVEMAFAGYVGAPEGTEFTAYVDEDVEVEGTPAQEPTPAVPRTVTAPVSPPTDVKTSPPAPAPAPTALPAAAPEPQTSPALAAPPPEVRPSAPAPVTPAPTPAVSAPSQATSSAPPSPAPAANPATRPAVPSAPDLSSTAERITVECFSDPSGAEILINGDYYGNTPSILKLKPTLHQLEMKMPGYKTYSQVLNLTENTGLRTIRAPLEKKE